MTNSTGWSPEPTVMLPPVPTPLWTLVVIWLSRRYTWDPLVVTVMLPPSASADWVVMLAFCMVKLLVTMFTLPASALAVPALFAEMVAPLRRLTGGAVILISPPRPVLTNNPPAIVPPVADVILPLSWTLT